MWLELFKEVRIEGKVQRIPEVESDAYFNSRPRGNQIGAWVSNQSQPIANRKELEIRMAEIEKRFEGKPIPRPEYWGGYCLSPTAVEFWLGRANRLHDRITYQLQEDKSWTKQRLAP